MSFEKLPIFLFHKEAVFEIGKLLGHPIKIYGIIANKSKLNQATSCIEIDVYKTLPSHFWLNALNKVFVVKDFYGKIPHYGKHCHKLGHLDLIV